MDREEYIKTLHLIYTINIPAGAYDQFGIKKEALNFLIKNKLAKKERGYLRVTNNGHEYIEGKR